MKTSALSRLILLPLASVALLAAPLALHAQEAEKTAPSPAEKRIDMHIPEGRLFDALKLLHEKFPEWDFTCEPKIAHLKVSDIQLHSADANDAALAVCRAMDMIAVDQPKKDDPIDRKFSFYYNRSLIDPESNKSVETGVEAFSLKDGNIEGRPFDEIAADRMNHMVQIQRMVLGTIDSIRQQGVLPVGETPRFQIYPEANVLIAIGSRDGIEITRKIVKAFNEPHLDLTAAHQQNARDTKGAASPPPSPASAKRAFSGFGPAPTVLPSPASTP